MKREQQMQPITISIAEGSRISDLSQRTLYRKMDEGLLESRKVGQRRLIVRTSLLRLIGCEDEVS